MFIPFDLIQRPRLGNLLCFGNDITYTTYLYFIFSLFLPIVYVLLLFNILRNFIFTLNVYRYLFQNVYFFIRVSHSMYILYICSDQSVGEHTNCQN